MHHVLHVNPSAHCLTHMQSLILEECRHLEDLSPLTQLTGLQKFAISSCRSIRDLQPLCDITQLHSLTIDRYKH